MSDTQEKFKRILRELGSSTNIILDPQTLDKTKTELVKIISEIKDDNTYYADIVSVVIALKKNLQNGDETLRHNLDDIVRSYMGYAPKDILKLQAYVNIEITRLDYIGSNFAGVEVQKKVAEAEAMIQQMQSTIEETEEKIADLHKQHITILGIFSGIVLSFVGGLVFSSSVLENIDKVSVYRLTFTALIIGLVLVNIMFGMFYFIGTMINKAEAKEALKPFKIANVLFIGGIILLIVLWLVGFVEWRDSLR